nr:hypothetical protein [Angustibacter aerolatus]
MRAPPAADAGSHHRPRTCHRHVVRTRRSHRPRHPPGPRRAARRRRRRGRRQPLLGAAPARGDRPRPRRPGEPRRVVGDRDAGSGTPSASCCWCRSATSWTVAGWCR